ncbi:hypothetical protein BDK51DRAFT_34297 [Blyttiomyces helicus]|uniref:RRM domain-containing protein n=1 Tax=Blyttiomyces helicus TaxID=388810 RepID=A0A4P9WHD5_9FUNG|nr:hypothetical protein BDK51DRAFT_34297 [Blyttiomyces helicus]|eukprot:RKO91355.1 hypothetical protein BDK51DRAFT_34297 [Blyttiomyces helicus]
MDPPKKVEAERRRSRKRSSSISSGSESDEAYSFSQEKSHAGAPSSSRAQQSDSPPRQQHQRGRCSQQKRRAVYSRGSSSSSPSRRSNSGSPKRRRREMHILPQKPRETSDSRSPKRLRSSSRKRQRRYPSSDSISSSTDRSQQKLNILHRGRSGSRHWSPRSNRPADLPFAGGSIAYGGPEERPSHPGWARGKPKLTHGFGHWGSPPRNSGMRMPPPPPSKTIMISRLDPLATIADVRFALKPFGPVDEIRLPKNRGIAFVDFADPSFARRVVEAEPPLMIFGRDVRISYAEPLLHRHSWKGVEADAPKMGFGHRASTNYTGPQDASAPQHSQRLEPISKTLVLAGLDHMNTEADIRFALQHYGSVVQIRLNRQRAIAFIDMADIPTATRVVEAAHPLIVSGRNVGVNYAKRFPCRKSESPPDSDRAMRTDHHDPDDLYYKTSWESDEQDMFLERGARFGSSSIGQRSKSPMDVPSHVLLLGNLHPSTLEHHIQESLKEFGDVQMIIQGRDVTARFAGRSSVRDASTLVESAAASVLPPSAEPQQPFPQNPLAPHRTRDADLQDPPAIDDPSLSADSRAAVLFAREFFCSLGLVSMVEPIDKTQPKWDAGPLTDYPI